MTHSPSIAVVVVNWNSGQYLGKCLQNLKDQVLPPARVLVVDNASTDGSIEGFEQRFRGWEFRGWRRGGRKVKGGEERVWEGSWLSEGRAVKSVD